MRVKRALMAVMATAMSVVTFTATAMAGPLNTWTGASDTHWSTAGNWTAGAPLSGHSLHFDNSALSEDVELTNDMSGLVLDSVAFAGDNSTAYGVLGSGFRLNQGVSASGSGQGLHNFDTPIVANANLTMRVDGEVGLGFFNTINTGMRTLTLHATQSGVILIGGAVTGSGAVVITGDGDSGTMFGPFANVRQATIVRNNGILFSDGRMGVLNVASTGHLMPYGCASTGNLTVAGRYYIDITGRVACSQYGQMRVRGGVNLTNALLDGREFGVTYNAARNTVFTLISNDGSDRVRGTFRGYPEGKRFRVSNQLFQISYRGGSGANDVTLKRL